MIQDNSKTDACSQAFYAAHAMQFVTLLFTVARSEADLSYTEIGNWILAVAFLVGRLLAYLHL